MSAIEIFEVQSAAAADGVYNCYKQKLLASGWQAGHGDKFADYDTVSVQVFNLIENNTVMAYEEALAKHDRIAAWEVMDDGGNTHWVGMPLTPSVREARTTEAAGASTSITCNLIDNDGETEIESGLGSGIEVYFKPTDGADLNASSPRFADDDYLFVQNISGKWWYVAAPQGNEDCNNP